MSARATHPTTVRFRLRVKRIAGARPFHGPVSVILRLADALYSGFIASCTTNAAGTVRCR